MKIDYGYLIVAFVAGILLGILYFGALWMTVRRVTRLRRPILTLGVSFLIRAGIIIAALFILMRGEWYNLLATFVGFIVGRFVLTERVKRSLYARVVSRHEGSK